MFQNYWYYFKITGTGLPDGDGAMQHCTLDPTLGGQAMFTYQLGKGEVMRASVDVSELSGEDASLRRCLDEAAWSLQIPAGQRDATRYLVHYPIRLVPPENAQARGEESELSPLVEMMLDGADILAR